MIVLASQSPRRKELMEKYITPNFVIDPSKNEEIIDTNLSPIENVKIISKAKGDNVFSRHMGDIVISADTIVVYKNKIYGKPQTKEDAKNILKELSNNNHEVITSYYIRTKDLQIQNTVISKVTFNKLSDSFIDQYIATGIPMDKAGAYAIQGEHGHEIVKSYQGSLSNIIGFPYEEILLDLKNNQLI